MAAPSTETTGKPHPYQYERVPGSAKGAYEARKVRAGFYVRVDMPDVPDDSVKVVKYSETRTVTFSAKAHNNRWAGLDDETRIYGGYVVLDRDIADVDFEYHLKHGCLRMFFRRCDGSLHFLSRHLPLSSSSTPTVTIEQNEEGQTATLGVEDEARGEDDEGRMPASFISHDPENPSAIRLAGGSPEHINPYQLSGVKGVYEHKIVSLDEGGEQMIYVRLDIPDTCDKTTTIAENPDKIIIFSAAAFKKEYYSRFDSASREYHGCISPTCQCCTYSVYKFVNVNGVLRLFLRKSDNNQTEADTVVHYHMPSMILTGGLLPLRVDLSGRLPPTLRSLRGSRRPSNR